MRAFKPKHIERYSTQPPSTAPKRFEPSDAGGFFERASKMENITPANPIGKALIVPGRNALLAGIINMMIF